MCGDRSFESDMEERLVEKITTRDATQSEPPSYGRDASRNRHFEDHTGGGFGRSWRCRILRQSPYGEVSSPLTALFTEWRCCDPKAERYLNLSELKAVLRRRRGFPVRSVLCCGAHIHVRPHWSDRTKLPLHDPARGMYCCASFRYPAPGFEFTS